MKSLLVLATMLLFGLSSFAANTVLLKSEMAVGFAPEGHRGVYSTTVLSNGAIEYKDNKGVVTSLAKLSKVALESLKTKIAELKKEPLSGNDIPACMDAPSVRTVVVKNGKEIVIKQGLSCKFEVMDSAYELLTTAEAIEQLKNSLL